MTVPLDDVNDIRAMDAAGVPRAEIARRLGMSRNTVAKYADMADMSPAAPEPRSRARRALGPDDAAWIDAVLEADSGAPRKQRHTAKRIYERLVAERGYKGSYSTARRLRARVAKLSPPRHRRGLSRARVGAGDRAGRLRQLRGRGGRRAPRAQAARRLATAPRRPLRPGLHVPALGVHVRGPLADLRADRARADKRGYVTVDGREYVAGPAWHSRELLNLPRFH